MTRLAFRRRAALSLGSAALVTKADMRPAAAASSPQSGDLLVFESGPRSGATIVPADLSPNTPPIVAWSMQPQTREIRNRSRFDLILLVRPPIANAPQAAAGIVGYSAICTHAACTVSGWKPTQGLLFCPCHASVYDPAAAGRVVSGPAPRPLPALPLRIADGVLTVAAGFTDRVGASTGRTD